MSLLDYIKGKRRGQDAHRLEREAMQDFFLSDAIDGFDAVEGRHAENVEAMRRRITQRARRTNRWLTYAGVAASLLICLVLGTYFLFVDPPDDFLATSEAPVKEAPVKPEKRTEIETIVEHEESEESEKFIEKETLADDKPQAAPQAARTQAQVRNQAEKRATDESTEDDAVQEDAREIITMIEDDTALEIAVQEAPDRNNDSLIFHRMHTDKKRSDLSTGLLTTRKGIVLDKYKEPLAGVAISVEGSGRGVTTDFNGRFAIEVMPTDTLLFSYIGMQKERLEAGGDRRELAVVMKEDFGQLDEVTVVAFAKQKKETVIGSMTVAEKPVERKKSETETRISTDVSDTTEAVADVAEPKSKRKEVTPEPVAGWKAYKKYLKDALQRPTEGDCAQMKGTVEVSFYVDKHGYPQDLEVTKSLCPDADEEVKRLIIQGDRWTIGTGQAVVKVKF